MLILEPEESEQILHEVPVELPEIISSDEEVVHDKDHVIEVPAGEPEEERSIWSSPEP